MLINKTVMVRWNGFTRKYYESRGYKWTKQNDLFECSIEDLQVNSTVKVEVKCDYCVDGVAFKEYRSYLKERELVQKDCCKNRKCMVNKSEEVNIVKYGVKNINQTDERKEYARKIFQTPIHEVIDISRGKDLQILNVDDYQNDRTRLYVICTNHLDKGIQETNFANIKKNKHCCKYVRPEITSKTKKLDGQIVYDNFLKNNLIPLFKPEEYQRNDISLPYKCPNHLDNGVQYRSYMNLEYCVGCEYCSRERTSSALKNNEDEVFSYFKSRDLNVLDNQKYINEKKHILFTCNKHPESIQQTSYHSLRNTKTPCEHCRIESSVGELNRRLRSSLSKWKKESEKKSNYKCVLTGSGAYDIHHLYSYNSIIKDSLKLLGLPIKEEYSSMEFRKIKNIVLEMHENYLGVCIRPDLHIIFHQVYGKHDNTPEQFEQFKYNYFNNKIKEVAN